MSQYAAQRLKFRFQQFPLSLPFVFRRLLFLHFFGQSSELGLYAYLRNISLISTLSFSLWQEITASKKLSTCHNKLAKAVVTMREAGELPPLQPDVSIIIIIIIIISISSLWKMKGNRLPRIDPNRPWRRHHSQQQGTKK